MQERVVAYTAMEMTKEQFFYAFKQLAQSNDCHLLLRVVAVANYV